MNSKHSTDHMANERTFLAWIRTSIGIMALGFVVEKFALFVKQVTVLSNVKPGNDFSVEMPQAGSAITGFLLILLGAVTGLLAYLKFRITSRQIDNENYKPLYGFDLFLTIAVVSAAIMLLVYLYPF